VHLIGLLSDGGVHSHLAHAKGILSMASQKGVKNIFLHAFTDGRDTDPHGGQHYLGDIQGYMKQTTGKLASVIGRYYAMDRDHRWERVRLAYDLLVKGKGKPARDVSAAIRESYENDVTDEFIMPIVMVDETDKPVATIENDDVVI